jgi:hypothetical protein
MNVGRGTGNPRLSVQDRVRRKAVKEPGWTYLTAPENLWAKVKDNGVEKEVRVVAIGINPNAPQAMDKDDGSNTVLLIAEPDNSWDRELKQQWHALAQVCRLFFRRRRRLGRW